MKLELCEVGPGTLGLESLSPFCIKVHRALWFYGMDYERRYGARPSSHKKYNPTGQAPVLLIDGEPVPDSTAIIKALEERSPKSLLPEGTREQAEAWFWEAYADGVLGYYVFAARWYDERNSEAFLGYQFSSMPAYLKPWLPKILRKRILKKMSNLEILRRGPDGCWRGFQEQLDMLEDRAPEHGFWVGDRLTVADIGIFSMLHSMRSALSAWQMQEIAKRGRLSAWLDRVDAATQVNS